jgi:N-acetylmuramoyl-L-alanine amidase
VNLRWMGCASRNFRAGRANHTVEAVVLHVIDGSQSACDLTFLNNGLANPVSAHYSISRTGEIHHYVQEYDTAFHAGKLVNPSWPGLKRSNGSYVNPNLYSIGIEHEGGPYDEWTDEMYAASAALLRGISRRYPALQTLSRENVALHREIRADKSCPGFRLDFDRLMSQVKLPPFVPLGGPRAVQIERAVNLRDGRPSTKAPILRVIPIGQLVNVVGFVRGDVVDQIPSWYATVNDEYFWAGATDDPQPGELP